MPVLTMPEGKKRITMGLKDDSVSPQSQAQKQLAPGANILQQTGKPANFLRDSTRQARLPGKRISASGKEYWESRRNRSDAPGSNL